jgi:hypothetical protein
MRGYYHDKEELQGRLRRIEGQVGGLRRMVENDEYCIDILTQVSAASNAAKKVAVNSSTITSATALPIRPREERTWCARRPRLSHASSSHRRRSHRRVSIVMITKIPPPTRTAVATGELA